MAIGAIDAAGSGEGVIGRGWSGIAGVEIDQVGSVCRCGAWHAVGIVAGTAWRLAGVIDHMATMEAEDPGIQWTGREEKKIGIMAAKAKRIIGGTRRNRIPVGVLEEKGLT